MRLEIGKQIGNSFDNVCLLLSHKYHYKLQLLKLFTIVSETLLPLPMYSSSLQ